MALVLGQPGETVASFIYDVPEAKVRAATVASRINTVQCNKTLISRNTTILERGVCSRCQTINDMYKKQISKLFKLVAFVSFALLHFGNCAQAALYQYNDKGLGVFLLPIAVKGGAVFEQAQWGVVILSVTVDGILVEPHGGPAFFEDSMSGRLSMTDGAFIYMMPESQVMTAASTDPKEMYYKRFEIPNNCSVIEIEYKGRYPNGVVDSEVNRIVVHRIIPPNLTIKSTKRASVPSE